MRVFPALHRYDPSLHGPRFQRWQRLNQEDGRRIGSGCFRAAAHRRFMAPGSLSACIGSVSPDGPQTHACSPWRATTPARRASRVGPSTHPAKCVQSACLRPNRKISGMKSAKKSSRTTPSNQSTLCAPNSSRRSSTSSAIPQWSNPSRLSPISPSHSNVEMV